MGGCRDPNCAVSKRGEERAAGCGLLVTSVLHNLTAGLPQVPELGTHEPISIQPAHTRPPLTVPHRLTRSVSSLIHSLNACTEGLTVASQPWPPKPLLLDTR